MEERPDEPPDVQTDRQADRQPAGGGETRARTLAPARVLQYSRYYSVHYGRGRRQLEGLNRFREPCWVDQLHVATRRPLRTVTGLQIKYNLFNDVCVSAGRASAACALTTGVEPSVRVRPRGCTGSTTARARVLTDRHTERRTDRQTGR